MDEQIIPTSCPRRNFNPKKTARYGIPTFSPKELVRYSPKYSYSRLYNFPFSGSHWRPRMNTIVVQVQGIAVPNNTADSDGRAAFGVSFGPSCPRNVHGLLPETLIQTQNRAFLEAVQQALNIVTGMRISGEFYPCWKELIIMVNSTYIATGFDRWIWRWEADNYLKRDGTPRQHSETWRELQNVLTHMEYELGIAIRFWKVHRQDISLADSLARAAMAIVD